MNAFATVCLFMYLFKYEELETALRNSGVLAHVAERENLEVRQRYYMV